MEGQMLLPLTHTEQVFNIKHNLPTGVMMKLLYIELSICKNTKPLLGLVRV